MNNIVNLQAFASRLAEITSSEPLFAEKFIRALVDRVSDNLAEGRSTTIPGIGTFGTETIGDVTNIIWQPDNSLAEEVNAPFSSFEPVELAPDVTMDMLSVTPSEPEPGTNPEPEPADSPEPEITDNNEPTPETVSTEKLIPPVVEADASYSTIEETDDSFIEENDYDSERSGDVSHSGSGWWLAFIVIVAAAIGYLCATYLPNPLLQKNIDNEKYETVMPEDTIVASETTLTETIVSDTATITDTTLPSTQETLVSESLTIVTDTVRHGRFLATMARRHYGSYKFWIYIYKENADHIPNPDNLPVGTVLIIPPAEKYGIDARDPASIAKAEAEIRKLETR